MSWKKAEKMENDRLIVGVWGRPKTGKTQFALSFPEPIYFHNFDWGIEHHLPGLTEREVYVANYLTPDLSAQEAENMLRMFERDYASALAQGKGTIVIDTTTQLWNLISKVFLEKIKAKRKDGQVYPFDYADANAYFQNLINQVKDSGMNMVLIQRAKEKYNASGQPSGEHEQQGNNGIPYLVQVQLHITKDGESHLAEIEECWNTTAAEGITLQNPSYSSLKNVIQTLQNSQKGATNAT